MVGASAMYHNFKMCKKLKEDGLLLATHSPDKLIKVIKFDTNKMNVYIYKSGFGNRLFSSLKENIVLILL